MSPKKALKKIPGVMALKHGLDRRRTRRALAAAGYFCGYRGDPKYFFVSDGRREIRVAAHQSGYAGTLFEQFDTYWNAIEHESPQTDAVLDLSRPNWFLLKRSRTRFFFTSFTEGDDLIDEYLGDIDLSPGDVALDLGANCGLVSIHLSRAVGPGGRVLAIEPDPTNFAALKINLEFQNAKNVEALNIAIWTAEGEASFEAHGTMGSAVAQGSGRQKTNVITVPTMTLEALAQKYQLNTIKYIKMDVEGAELSVLPASPEFIRRTQAQWVIEVHDRLHGIEKLAPLFLSSGYDVNLVSVWPAPLIRCTPRARRNSNRSAPREVRLA